MPTETFTYRKISKHGLLLDGDGPCPPQWHVPWVKHLACVYTSPGVEETQFHSMVSVKPSARSCECGLTGDMPSAAVITVSLFITVSRHLACSQSDLSAQLTRMWDITLSWPLPGRSTAFHSCALSGTPLLAHSHWCACKHLFQHLALTCTQTLHRRAPTNVPTPFILHTHPQQVCRLQLTLM